MGNFEGGMRRGGGGEGGEEEEGGRGRGRGGGGGGRRDNGGGEPKEQQRVEMAVSPWTMPLALSEHTISKVYGLHRSIMKVIPITQK